MFSYGLVYEQKEKLIIRARGGLEFKSTACRFWFCSFVINKWGFESHWQRERGTKVGFVCEVSLALGHEWHSLYYYIVYLPSSSCFFKGKVGLGHVISSYFIVLSVTECQRTHQLHKDRPEHCRINRLKYIINSVLTTMWSNWSHCRLYWNIFSFFLFGINLMVTMREQLKTSN